MPSFFRRWQGDYLSDTTENLETSAYRAALQKNSVGGADKVVFSAVTVKHNRHSKSNSRAVVFTKDNRHGRWMDKDICSRLLRFETCL